MILVASLRIRLLERNSSMAGSRNVTEFFKRNTKPHDGIDEIPEAPPWRRFDKNANKERGEKFHATDEMVELVNAALLLRRPLLVTGKPGTGKSSLAFAVAFQLDLDEVLHWPI